jgi:hypothetical protein
MQNVASQMFNEDPASAVEMLKKLPDDDTKDQIISKVADSWVTNDINSAATYAAAMPAGAGQASLVNAVANQMANDDPSKALDWTSGLQDSPGKT